MYIAAATAIYRWQSFSWRRAQTSPPLGFFGAPSLHWAAINGHKPMVEFLISHGADLTLRDQQFNSTALGWMLEGKQKEIAGLLALRGVGQ